jgi:hypothetical protein
MGGRTGTKRATARALALFGAALMALSACARNPFVLTECVDGRPVVERTLDVAPPNC